MFYQNNSRALAASAGDRVRAWQLPGEQRACRVAQLKHETFRYRSYEDPRTELRLRIREIAQTRAIDIGR